MYTSTQVILSRYPLRSTYLRIAWSMSRNWHRLCKVAVSFYTSTKCKLDPVSIHSHMFSIFNLLNFSHSYICSGFQFWFPKVDWSFGYLLLWSALQIFCLLIEYNVCNFLCDLYKFFVYFGEVSCQIYILQVIHMVCDLPFSLFLEYNGFTMLH